MAAFTTVRGCTIVAVIQHHSALHFCLPAAGVTSENILKCFGGSLGLSYTYSKKITVGGGLSGDDCKRAGGGDGGKNLVKNLIKSKVRLFFGNTIRAHVPWFPVGSIPVNGQTAYLLNTPSQWLDWLYFWIQVHWDHLRNTWLCMAHAPKFQALDKDLSESQDERNV